MRDDGHLVRHRDGKPGKPHLASPLQADPEILRPLDPDLQEAKRRSLQLKEAIEQQIDGVLLHRIAHHGQNPHEGKQSAGIRLVEFHVSARPSGTPIIFPSEKASDKSNTCHS